MKRYDAQYYRDKGKERYEYLKRIGMCSCGERAIPGKVCCIKCTQIKAAREKIRRENMTDEEKEKRRIYMKEYNSIPEHRARRRQYGLEYKGGKA